MKRREFVAQRARLVELGIVARRARSRRRAAAAAARRRGAAASASARLRVEAARARARPPRARPAASAAPREHARRGRARGEEPVAQAARSRGPPRPRPSRESARGEVRRALEDARAGARADRRSRRGRRRHRAARGWRPTSVSGPASRSASSRAPPGVTRAVDRGEQAARPLAARACASVRDWRGSPRRSASAAPAPRASAACSGGRAAELRLLDIGERARRPPRSRRG